MLVEYYRTDVEIVETRYKVVCEIDAPSVAEAIQLIADGEGIEHSFEQMSQEVLETENVYYSIYDEDYREVSEVPK